MNGHRTLRSEGLGFGAQVSIIVVRAEPVIVPRAQHHDFAPEHRSGCAEGPLSAAREPTHRAYLVGGSVRDLLLGRRPKDFDIGTDAHPYQIKKLFRNCWIIGRRFRLAHIKFGTKTIEVATFRKNVPCRPIRPADEESVVVPARTVEAVT